MLEAIIKDIVESQFEWNNHRLKDFDFLFQSQHYTDDSVKTISIAQISYRIPENIREITMKYYLNEHIKELLDEFEERYML